MNPTLTLEDAGLKISQLPVTTVTDESDFKASMASGIGDAGVSAQTTKPVETTMRATRIPIAILNLRRILVLLFHPVWL